MTITAKGWLAAIAAQATATAAAAAAAAAQATADGGMIKVAEINVAVDAQDVTFPDLDGDTDGTYVLDFHIQHGPTAAAATTSIQPNGVSTDQKSQYMYANGGAAAGGARNELNISDAGSDVTTIEAGRVVFQAKTGRPRTYVGNSIQFAAALYIVTVGGRWTDTAANITSLVIHSSLADGLGAGSRFVLWKMPG